jgi:transcriptional regulator with XRE-family HTH domain
VPKTDRGLSYWEQQIGELNPLRVAERLEALREAMRLTPAEMARRIGVSSSEYHNWLPGTRKDGTPKDPTRLKLHHAAAIAQKCQVTIDYIALGEMDGIAEPLRTEIAARLRIVARKNSPKRKP